MVFRPMLFNTEMTRAILRGEKRQTRRLCKAGALYEPYFTVEDGKPLMCDENGEWFPAEDSSKIQAGDILWVRETWAKDAGRYMYRANYSDTEKFYMNGREIRMTWRPSIHMPKDAARLFLRVENVRFERLQDMSAQDCALDGGFNQDAARLIGAARLFGPLWDSTIKQDDKGRYGWGANPWVYVYDFVRVERPEGF